MSFPKPFKAQSGCGGVFNGTSVPAVFLFGVLFLPKQVILELFSVFSSTPVPKRW